MESELATALEEAFSSVPSARRSVLARVAGHVNGAVPAGYAVTVVRGRVAWVTAEGEIAVALEYNCRECALYFLELASDPERLARFRTEWLRSGKPLWMNHARLRFRRWEDLVPRLIRKAVAERKRLSCDNRLS